MIASAKEKDALNITLSSCINSTNVHLCNYCTKIFVIVVNTCVCRRSVDNKVAILSYPILIQGWKTQGYRDITGIVRFVCTIPFLYLRHRFEASLSPQHVARSSIC